MAEGDVPQKPNHILGWQDIDYLKNLLPKTKEDIRNGKYHASDVDIVDCDKMLEAALQWQYYPR